MALGTCRWCYHYSFREWFCNGVTFAFFLILRPTHSFRLMMLPIYQIHTFLSKTKLTFHQNLLYLSINVLIGYSPNVNSTIVGLERRLSPWIFLLCLSTLAEKWSEGIWLIWYCKGKKYAMETWGLKCVFGNNRKMESLISWDSVLKQVTENVSSVINHLECGDHLVFILETEAETCPQSESTKGSQAS